MHSIVFSCLLMSLGFGVTLVFSSSHWLLAWMGLEINTLAILPLMAKSHHPRALEATTKYFLIQATAAALILFASLTHAWFTGEWGISHLFFSDCGTIVMLALFLKVGLAPVHFWLPEVLQGVSLITGLVLSTWQKLAPFVLIVQVAPFANSYVLVIAGLVSVVVGGWGGLNQAQLRKVLAYSSIAHLGWIVVVVQFAPHLATFGLFLYVAMTSAAFLILDSHNSTVFNSLSVSWAQAPFLAVALVSVLLSLGGLPPLSGFLSKWFVINEMVSQSLPFIATLIALSALLSLYYYLRLSYGVALTSVPNNTVKVGTWRVYPK
nr:NADH dehydrogenase subunit 2 [Argyropelecus hemigymnus]